MGTGAFSNLRLTTDYDRISAVVISHMHADHFIDLIPLRYALKYGRKRRDDRVTLLLPPGGEAMLRAMTEPFAGEPGAFLDDVFALAEYDPSGTVRLGTGTLSFAETVHYIPTYALRYDCPAGSVTYSADTARDSSVGALGRETDILICEATLLPGESEGEYRGHSSTLDAAEMADEAGAKMLLLTHYVSEADVPEMIAIARAAFAGRIAVADDGDVYAVGEAASA